MAKNKFNNAIGPEIRKKKNIENTGFKITATLLMFSGFLLVPQIAVQFIAYSFNYSPALGNPLFGKIYSPFKLSEWSIYQNQYPKVFEDAYTFGFIGLVPIILILIAYKASLSLKLKGNEFLHGSAHWADREDIVRAGLLPREFSLSDKLKAALHLTPPLPVVSEQEGVFVGAWTDPKTKKTHYLRHNGPEHVLCVAPTRSGKGVGLVNPTLLTWKQSCFVTDLKGELWALTAGWRKEYAHNKCIKFEPALARRKISKEGEAPEYNTARWNPLDEIRSEGSKEYFYDPHTKEIKTRICAGENEIADVQNIATLIVDPDGKGLEDHWAKTAFALLVGCIIHLKLNIPEACNMYTLDLMLAGEIDTRKLRDKRRMNGGHISENDYERTDVANLWADMQRGIDLNGQPYAARKAVITAGSDMHDRPDEEAGSVLSTAKSFLALYRDPIVAANTSKSDFKIKQLMNLSDPVSLYVVTQPTDKSRLVPLVRLLVNLVIRLLADKMEFAGGRSVKGYAHRLLLMLDEFPSLGKLDIIQESLAFVAGYGLKCYLITQDMSQIFAKYGKDESISSNCHVSNFYAPLRVETAEIMSKKVGTTTIVKESASIQGSGLKASKTRSIQETGRALLTPDECMQLPSPVKDAYGNIVKPGDMLIFVAGFPPIYGVQPLYFQNPVLLDRAKIPCPSGSDVLIDEMSGLSSDELTEGKV